MKITKTYLRQIIKEELKRVLKEGTNLPMSYLEVGTDYDPETGAEITKFDDFQIKGRVRDKNVVKLQRFLISKGALPKGADDGKIGPDTTKAYNLVFNPKKPLTPQLLASLIKKRPYLFDLATAGNKIAQQRDNTAAAFGPQ